MVELQRWLLWVVASVVAAGLLAAGCGSGDDDAAAGTTTTESTTTTSDTTTSSQPADTTAPPAPDQPPELATGTFVPLDHAGTGTARVLQLDDGRRVVRLEGFATDDGPDLYVYLSANPADGPEAAFDDDFVDLGRLQATTGDQDYDVASDVDLSAYASVVVWCDSFDSAFTAADLAPPAA